MRIRVLSHLFGLATSHNSGSLHPHSTKNSKLAGGPLRTIEICQLLGMQSHRNEIDGGGMDARGHESRELDVCGRGSSFPTPELWIAVRKRLER
jgi:hypothetical protein